MESDLSMSEVLRDFKDLASSFGLQQGGTQELAERIRMKFSRKTFGIAVNNLMEKWNKRHFPMFPDFVEAFTGSHVENVKYEPWQEDYARRLGIPVQNLPPHASQLTEYQRKVLDIPEERVRKELLGKIWKTIDDLSSRMVTLPSCDAGDTANFKNLEGGKGVVAQTYAF